MPSLSAAAYISMTDIAADIKEMTKGLHVCAALLKNTDAEGAHTNTTHTGFVSKLAVFQAESLVALAELNTQISTATTQFEDLCGWLGEDAKCSSPGAIFLTICGIRRTKFVISIEKVRKDAPGNCISIENDELCGWAGFANLLVQAHEENEVSSFASFLLSIVPIILLLHAC
jgi:hypothetical protein